MLAAPGGAGSILCPGYTETNFMPYLERLSCQQGAVPEHAAEIDATENPLSIESTQLVGAYTADFRTTRSRRSRSTRWTQSPRWRAIPAMRHPRRRTDSPLGACCITGNT